MPRPKTKRPIRRRAGDDIHSRVRECLFRILNDIIERRLTMKITNEQAQRIAMSAIKRLDAQDALDRSERLGQREQARRDRQALANAESALRSLITEAAAAQ